MRGMAIILGIALGLGGCSDDAPEAIGPNIPQISYKFDASFSDAGPNTLKITSRFLGDEDGETILRFGGNWADENLAMKRFKDLSVTGAGLVLPEGGAEILSENLSQQRMTISHTPETEITVSYTLSQADMRDAAVEIEYFYAPVLTDDVIHLIGATSLVVPHNTEDQFDVSVNWSGLPNDWKAVDSIPNGPIYGAAIRALVLAAAPADNISKSGSGGTLTLLKTGEHDFSTEDFSARMSEVYSGLNKIWDTSESKFLVTLLGTPPNSSSASLTGTGRYDSFALASTPGIDLEFLTGFLAHELAHHWVPGKLGSWGRCEEAQDCPPRISWFSEGFTDFVMTRAMLEQGYWDQKDVIDFTNRYLRSYHMSPARNGLGHQIDELFWQDFEYERQPYWRGFLMAMNWDRDIKTNTENASSVMDIMRSMYSEASAAIEAGSEEDYPVLTADYIAEKFSAQADRKLFEDVERYYYNGETLEIRPDLFPGCAELRPMPVYGYDVGFDPGATLSSGIVAGVVPGHNGAKAGLKNGQSFIDKVSGGGGDTTIPIVLEVKDGEKTLTLSYMPVSGDPVMVPQFEYDDACRD